MAPITDFSGVWRSHYTFQSSSRQGTFESEHLMRVSRRGDTIVLESVPAAKSYLVIRLTLDDDIATGSWEEHTEKDGYYKGAVYYGAIQFTIDKDKKHMSGKWVGFGRDMKVNTGPWELTYVGETAPNED